MAGGQRTNRGEIKEINPQQEVGARSRGQGDDSCIWQMEIIGGFEELLYFVAHYPHWSMQGPSQYLSSFSPSL